MGSPVSLSILHVLRAPVGGLFRHVLDLSEGQAARGHQVGIVAAADHGGMAAKERLAAIAGRLSLGVHRIAMKRQPGLSDIMAIRMISARLAATRLDVVHGHGAKGGAYARLAHTGSALRVYTPHGGSLHYGRTLQGRLFSIAERFMMRRTDLFLFESTFARSAFEYHFGTPSCTIRVVPNGVAPAEFEPLAPLEPQTETADLVALGELRHLKGIDVLIEAIAILAKQGRRVTAAIAGDGPDRSAFSSLAERHGLGEAVRFLGQQPARIAFAQGRLLVVASRAESLPYVVLEAAAAGVPMLATRVGGIPEIFGPDADRLLPPADPAALATAIAAALDDPGQGHLLAERLRVRVRHHYSQHSMVDGVINAYRSALQAR